MAHEILTAWFTSHTLNHKKGQRTKQEVFHQRKLEAFFQVWILHGLNSSRDLQIRGHHLALSRYLAVALVFSWTRLPTFIFDRWSIYAYMFKFWEQFLMLAARRGEGQMLIIYVKQDIIWTIKRYWHDNQIRKWPTQ